MKHNIHFSVEARGDLEEIWDSIKAEPGHPTAARKMVTRIPENGNRLDSFPGLASPLSLITHTATDDRYLVPGTFLTFDRIVGHDVYVDRILYGRRNDLHILFRENLEKKPHNNELHPIC